MKTRIIQTKFWKDNYILELSPTEKLLFNYLITNENIGLSNYYECPDRIIQFETALSSTQLETIKEKFSQDNKFYFHGGWVFIVNGEKYNNYTGSKNETARNRELSMIPDSVLNHFDTVSIGYLAIADSLINHKSKTINHKSKKEGEKKEKKIDKSSDEIDQVLTVWNETMGTSLTSSRSWQDNYQKWRQDFTLDKILEAIRNIPNHKWLNDKATPVIFFRTNLDWIEQCLNLKAQPTKKQLPSNFV